ncbi:MAG: 30S ribosomal protein S1, partial [bacterium]|nr:30S ribosomal protein S1 [bacterium]
MVDLKDDQSQLFEDGIDEQQNFEGGGDLNPGQETNSTNIQKTAGKVVKLEELTEEQEYSDSEINELQKLYENTINSFVEGELVVGTILAISDKEVTVDIGFKSEGTIPIEEFSKPDQLKVGDDIEVFLESIEDLDGQMVLSRKKVDFIHSWEKIVSSYENGDILEGRCVRRIKGGIVVDLDGIDAFLPGSQIDVKPIRDFDSFIGQNMELKVVKVNQLRKNIVVSHRVLVEEEMKEQREKILENLEKGQILEGSVKNITDFGVFIDLGGVDGLLHINDLCWGRISHPSEIVALDEVLKVMVLDFNDEKNRISLGLKQLQPHPWENVAEKYPVGTVVKGKVVNISDYGAFVELEKGVEGLIHISEMSWTQHIKHPSKMLAVGEQVETKILNIDPEDKKISLGLKQLEPDPWDTLGDKYPVGSQHEGKVRNLTNFGAFIELEEGIDGLIHISDLSWTKKIRHPGEVLKKGDTI